MEGTPAWPDRENSPDGNINENQEPTHNKAATSNIASELFSLWKDYKKRVPEKVRRQLSRVSGISKAKGLGAKNRD